MEEWTILPLPGKVPQQQNDYDCGVFSCCFANYYAQQQAFNFSQNDMPEMHLRIAAQMIQTKAESPGCPSGLAEPGPYNPPPSPPQGIGRQCRLRNEVSISVAEQGNRPPAVHRPAPPPSGSEADRPKDKACTRMGKKLINAKMPKGQQASNRSLLEEKKSKDHTEREASPLLRQSRLPPPQ